MASSTFMHNGMLFLRPSRSFLSKGHIRCCQESIFADSNLAFNQPLFANSCAVSTDPQYGTFGATSPVQPDYMRKLPPRSHSQCLSVGIKKSLVSVGNKFQLDDIIESRQFDRDILNAIFEVALEMEKIEKNSSRRKMLRGYLMATLFYEPSTQTRLSFESAMKRLGGEVLTTENAREFSSAAKGETLEDTIRTVEGLRRYNCVEAL